MTSLLCVWPPDRALQVEDWRRPFAAHWASDCGACHYDARLAKGVKLDGVVPAKNETEPETGRGRGRGGRGRGQAWLSCQFPIIIWWTLYGLTIFCLVA